MRLPLLKELYLKEDIYGTNAVVYHRTTKPENVNNIFQKGFQASAGDWYGKGLYAVSDLNKEGQDNAETYGSVIIKFKVNLKNFLVFDEKKAKRVHGRDWDISSQFKKFGIKLDPELIQWFEEDLKQNKLSSHAAKVASEHDEIVNKVDGFVFYGKTDGDVVVGFQPQNFTMLGWAWDAEGRADPKSLEWSRNISGADAIKAAQGKGTYKSSMGGPTGGTKSSVYSPIARESLEFLFDELAYSDRMGFAKVPTEDRQDYENIYDDVSDIAASDFDISPREMLADIEDKETFKKGLTWFLQNKESVKGRFEYAGYSGVVNIAKEIVRL